MNRLWFTVCICRDCWDRVADREPVTAMTGAEPCVRCGDDVAEPIFVRACWPAGQQP